MVSKPVTLRWFCGKLTMPILRNIMSSAKGGIPWVKNNSVKATEEMLKIGYKVAREDKIRNS